MDDARRYRNKAELYARYRWDYAPAAIQAIFDMAGLHRDCTVADVGAGTGILARHFVERASRVYAVEPEPEMRRWADRALARYPSFRCVAGRAEATGLPDQCADLITVGQALHWFAPEPARLEFYRILKPGGWLAVLRNRPAGGHLGAALGEVFALTQAGRPPAGGAPEHFYPVGGYRRHSFTGMMEETWEEFLGALCSDSAAPEEGTPQYGPYESAARGVFERFSVSGRIAVDYVTELCLGHLW